VIDEIKKFPNLSGIYLIKSPTGLIYIGEAKNLRSMVVNFTTNRIS